MLVYRNNFQNIITMGIPDIGQPGYVTTAVADVMMSNRRLAISYR